MSILVVDNYDSFTYNLVQYLGELGCDIQVHRNDAVSLAEISSMKPDCIVISPGPGLPSNAGISVSLVQEFAGRIPSWESVWVIRPSEKPLEPRWSVLPS